ncbi:hypothetical protein OS493_004774 [Desmophyllum pertusum]|uniref:Uncharacterized protein n=1 Tax=Desmophyllum pertusum TaxID=174260 RepID=A0A9W9ZH04_9CNID|nr:hypothetical protein OS493_004774 [Desmophyllum pertusum]
MIVIDKRLLSKNDCYGQTIVIGKPVNEKTNQSDVEVKKAEKREAKSSGMMGGMPGMNPYQQQHHQQAPGGHPGYGVGAYAQQASYGMQHPIGMGRGFPNYGAMGGAAAGAATGYAGPPGPAPAQGYLYGAVGVATAQYDPNAAAAAAAAAMYARGSAAGYGAGYGAGAVGASQHPTAASAAGGFHNQEGTLTTAGCKYLKLDSLGQQ